MEGTFGYTRKAHLQEPWSGVLCRQGLFGRCIERKISDSGLGLGSNGDSDARCRLLCPNELVPLEQATYRKGLSQATTASLPEPAPIEMTPNISFGYIRAETGFPAT